MQDVSSTDAGWLECLRKSYPQWRIWRLPCGGGWYAVRARRFMAGASTAAALHDRLSALEGQR